MKLEQLANEVFPHTELFAMLEVACVEEFSLLKNAPRTGAGDSRDEVVGYLEAVRALGLSCRRTLVRD